MQVCKQRCGGWCHVGTCSAAIDCELRCWLVKARVYMLTSIETEIVVKAVVSVANESFNTSLNAYRVLRHSMTCKVLVD
jgi:hypothetical protein